VLEFPTSCIVFLLVERLSANSYGTLIVMVMSVLLYFSLFQ